MADDFNDYGELARIAHDLALWYEAQDVACPCCEAYKVEHAALCPIGRSITWRKANASA